MRSLPRIVSSIPNDVRSFLDKVREYITTGDDNRFVTVGELRASGIAGTTPGGSLTLPTVYSVQDPPAPTGLSASGALDNIIITWDEPNYAGHAYTEVWADDTDTFEGKILIGMTAGGVFNHAIGAAATKYYWIRFVNTLNTAGPFNATAGTMGQTAADPEYYIGVLSDEYGVAGVAPFFHLDNPTVINGVTIPAGTYIKEAWIADATIGNAKIRNLAVDTAKIADLSVSTIKLDDLAVTAAKIANATITAAKIEDAAITNAKIANATISFAKIDVATFNSLSALTANLGTVTAGRMQSTDGKFVIDLTNKYITISV